MRPPLPPDDTDAALAYYAYAVEHRLRLDDVGGVIAAMQTTRAQRRAVFAAIEARWPSPDEPSSEGTEGVGDPRLRIPPQNSEVIFFRAPPPPNGAY